MNILFISSQPYPYGMAASKRIRLFAEYLAKRNQVKVFITGRNNDRNDNYGVKKRVEWNFVKFNRIEYFLNIFKIHSILKNNFLRREKNIILLYDGIGLTNFVFAILGRKMGYNIFTDIVEDYSLHEENTGFLLSALHKINILVDKKTSYFVDGIIVITKRLFEKYLKLYILKNNMILIPVSAENLLIDLQKNSYPENYRLMYSGSFGNKDGVDILIKAFKEISKIYPSIELILTGKINDTTKKLIKDIPQIKFIGLISDKEYYQFLKNADVLMMTRINSPYANTGFPFKLGEYLATGNPVISTDVSDICLYLEDRRDVILANPSDVLSLVNSIRFVLENKDKAIKIGENGYNKCMAYFNPITNGKNLELFLQNT